MTRCRVLLAEDHALVRAGFRAILEAEPQIEVVGEAADGPSALRLAEELRPDVVVMDISMPGLNGIEATRHVVRLPGAPRVLVVSMHEDRGYVRQALAAGAAGYVVKTAEPLELAKAILAVAHGEEWISRAVSAAAAPSPGTGGGIGDLTGRQREVLQLIAEGNTTRQIARRLEISVKTVETHRAQLMERLDIHTVAGLVRFAIRNGMISADGPER